MGSAIIAGDIVLVDWRDKHFPSEPGRIRPAIVVVADHGLNPRVRFFSVVPLTGDANLAPLSWSSHIDPDESNGLKKTCYALAWNIQTVASVRVTRTGAKLASVQLGAVRSLVVEYLTAAGDTDSND